MRRPAALLAPFVLLLSLAACGSTGTITMDDASAPSPAGGDAGSSDGDVPIHDVDPVDASPNPPSDWESDTSDLGLTVHHPADWEFQEDELAAYVFVDPAGESDFRRNINVFHDDRAPYESLEQYTEISLRQFDGMGTAHGEVVDTELSGRPAQQLVYDAPTAVDLRALGVWTIVDGAAWLVTYTAPPDRFDEDLPEILVLMRSIELPI